MSGSFAIEERLARYLSDHYVECNTDEAVDRARRMKEYIGPLFSRETLNTPRWAALGASAQWATDGAINREDTAMSFVFYCMALEAILGESGDPDAVTRSLSDRAAYILGRDVEEREKIRKVFAEIYRFRSKIVHGVWSGRITEFDSELSSQLCLLVDDVIKKELELRHLVAKNPEPLRFLGKQ